MRKIAFSARKNAENINLHKHKKQATELKFPSNLGFGIDMFVFVIRG
jgi:hypothetical protein